MPGFRLKWNRRPPDHDLRETSGSSFFVALAAFCWGLSDGKRSISAETALRLSPYFGNSAQFWMNLQTRHDLAVVEQEKGARIEAEVVHAA